MSSSDPSALIIAFGKYRGLTVAELLDRDPSYAQWLLGQAWLADRFAELHAALAGRGAAQDDTPEHNAIQARFADHKFRLAFLEATIPDLIADEQIRMRLWNAQNPRHANPPPFDTPATAAHFERHGIDVVILWNLTHAPDKTSSNYLVGIEIKPSLGDDYPAVMRQIERTMRPLAGQRRCCLIDSYAGRTVPYQQLREMFAANGVILVTLREVTDHLWPPE